MTVAIAAICKMQGFPLVIAAEDHMITAGDVEFEQPQPKIWQQGPHAIAMTYGDSAAQAEIAIRSEAEVVANGIKEIPEIARIYGSKLMNYVRRAAEADILAPLQLSHATFLAHQSAMHSDLVSRISRDLQHYYTDSGMYRSLGGAIVAGADGRGAHLFRVEYGTPIQLDHIGFVAAGSGQWHAESQFMFSRYTREWDFPEALSLVYAAKKRAEVAPGVGSETDIVAIATSPPQVWHFRHDSELVKELDKIYGQANEKHDAATGWQHQKVREWVTKFVTQQTPSVAQPAQSPLPKAKAQKGDAKPRPAKQLNGKMLEGQQ